MFDCFLHILQLLLFSSSYYSMPEICQRFNTTKNDNVPSNKRRLIITVQHYTWCEDTGYELAWQARCQFAIYYNILDRTTYSFYLFGSVVIVWIAHNTCWRQHLYFSTRSSNCNSYFSVISWSFTINNHDSCLDACYDYFAVSVVSV